MTMGKAMKNARLKAKLTQKRFSEVSGVNFRLISRYEKDEIRPRIDTVETLADALGISIDEFVGHEVIQNDR